MTTYLESDQIGNIFMQMYKCPMLEHYHMEFKASPIYIYIIECIPLERGLCIY
jgi:hypothetical protein